MYIKSYLILLGLILMFGNVCSLFGNDFADVKAGGQSATNGDPNFYGKMKNSWAEADAKKALAKKLKAEALEKERLRLEAEARHAARVESFYAVGRMVITAVTTTAEVVGTGAAAYIEGPPKDSTLGKLHTAGSLIAPVGIDTAINHGCRGAHAATVVGKKIFPGAPPPPPEPTGFKALVKKVSGGKA